MRRIGTVEKAEYDSGAITMVASLDVDDYGTLKGTVLRRLGGGVELSDDAMEHFAEDMEGMPLKIADDADIEHASLHEFSIEPDEVIANNG